MFSDIPLYEVVKDIFMSGYEGVIIDEIHYARDWNLHLKALYDDFPLLFSVPVSAILHGHQGTAREAMVACLCAEAGWKVETTRDDSTGDFIINRNYEKLKIEVGGSSKKIKSADFVIRDDTDYPAKNVIPLWLLGMSW